MLGTPPQKIVDSINLSGLSVLEIIGTAWTVRGTSLLSYFRSLSEMPNGQYNAKG